ncbi:hypothetical protein Vadar_020443 [Vaccinium darrowii]|uniref:Uncharacterized protein n=1 Tax=Vaccinium darrowii TaxID=229202 RepID=A0ACB7Y0F9_9ERIC|nr:hypothetical protein Vadar_020443 [Vaccinium darrowii]
MHALATIGQLGKAGAGTGNQDLRTRSLWSELCGLWLGLGLVVAQQQRYTQEFGDDFGPVAEDEANKGCDGDVSTYALPIKDVLEFVSDTVVVNEYAASRIQMLTKGFWGSRTLGKSGDYFEDYSDPEREHVQFDDGKAG